MAKSTAKHAAQLSVAGQNLVAWTMLLMVVSKQVPTI